MWFLALIFRILLFTALIWGSIKAVDPDNTKNKWSTALIIAAVLSLISALFGGLLFILPLVAYFLILVKYYDLGLLQALISVVIMFAISFAIGWVLSLFISREPRDLEEASRQLITYFQSRFA
jgi:hypothetical protein